MNNKLLEGIQDLTYDSRCAGSSIAFVCKVGGKFDGHDFISEAIAGGVKLVIASRTVSKEVKISAEKSGCNIVEAEQDFDSVLSFAVNKIYSKQPKVFAITGTDGKTSTVSFACQIMNLMGVSAISLGTTGIFGKIKGVSDLSELFVGTPSLTTPDEISLKRVLHKAAILGCEYAFIEASSIGIHQGRLRFIRIDGAGFTTFSQDHLDYHGTMDEYLEQKLRLFSLLDASGIAIINERLLQNDRINSVFKKLKQTQLSYGYNSTVNIHIKCLEYCQNDTKLEICYNRQEYRFAVSLVADFLVENLMCAVLAVTGFGFDITDTLKIISGVRSAVGRLEIVQNDYGLNIIIDYAHTPDALQKAICGLKSRCLGRLIVLFGCGGDRDSGKRSQMGAVACKYADFAIITDDNPRNEEAAKIRQDIIAGIAGLNNFVEIAGRKEAIEYGIKNLGYRDILLLAGKGHETYQIVGCEIIHLDEREVVKDILMNK